MNTAERLQIQALAREFADAEVRPWASEWDSREALGSDVLGQLGGLGFTAMRLAEGAGGLGLDLATYALVLEALATGDASLALAVSTVNGPVMGLLGHHATFEQRERWLPGLVTGERFWAVAPSGLLDADGASHVEARRTEEGWVLTGSDPWVPFLEGADALVVFTQKRVTYEEKDTPAAFVVSRGSPGFSVGRRGRMMGLRPAAMMEATLEGVPVDESAVIDLDGGEDASLDAIRGVTLLGVAATALGVAQAAFEYALSYALERRQFGQAIADFGATRHKLAEMGMRIAGTRALTRDAAVAMESGGRGDPVGGSLSTPLALATMAKVMAAEAAMWVADQAVQIFGGYGYMRDYPVEKLMRDAKGVEIMAGTGEALRQELARYLVPTTHGWPR